MRDAILRAALRLFGDRGYDACSVQDVAERARVTKPMVHYYFESKAGLLRAVLESVITGMFERLRAVAAEDGRPVRERVDAIARRAGEGFEKQPGEARFMRRLLYSDPPRDLPRFDRKQIKEMLAGFYQGFLTMAEQGVRSGELRGEPRVIAALLHAVFAYAPSAELLFGSETRERSGRWTEEMLSALWTGVVAHPTRES